ncbi:hypothetical protein [Alkalibacillus filiformis]|uniref:hypothetical protein n=1 Tax=Alkalibacillus filiformis TaxID=200990 RepID=UPI0027D790BA|nr:hypothetical protein [Alkalibacillus filiformis]
MASHNFVGEVIWFQDNNRFLYRSSEALYTYDLKNNKIDELQGVGGGSTQISPNEDIITVVDRNELLVFSLDSGEINERIRFPEYQKPKSIVSWDESGFPLLIASYQEGAGFSLFKMRNNRSVNNLDITISSDWNSPNPWYEQVDNYVYMKDNNTLLYFDLEKENFYEVGDFNQIMTVSPGRTKVGGYSNGPVVHNLDPIEKRLYESSHSEADPYLWKWLDDDSFVIVERQLYLSGFMGDRSLLEVHNVSEGSSIISMEIPRPLFNNVYWAEEARQIFVQSAENEILVYDVVQ